MHTIVFDGRIIGNNLRHNWKLEAEGKERSVVEEKFSTVEFLEQAPIETFTQFQIKGFFAIGSPVKVTITVEEDLQTQKNADYEDVVRERDALREMLNKPGLIIEEEEILSEPPKNGEVN